MSSVLLATVSPVDMPPDFPVAAAWPWAIARVDVEAEHEVYRRSQDIRKSRRWWQRRGDVPPREVHSHGWPNGGDGGRRGRIYAVADRNINTLVDYRYTRKFIGKRGENGGGADQYGAGGDDIVLRMPVGTVFYDLNTEEVVADLAEHGQKVLIARGGKGGLGNLHFKSSTNRAPRQKTNGEEGEEFEFRLELRVLADVGLLGLPNAGKSTLIRAISAARPKVADYPFTTLHPNLGVVRVDDERSFVVADVPGLIEGAADGAGLGVRFLKHLQRTRILLHLVDIAPIDPEANPVRDAKAIVGELLKHDPALADKPRWLVLNKLDLIPAENREKAIKAFLKAYKKATKYDGPAFPIAAISGEGTKPLIYAIQEALEKMARPEIDDDSDTAAGKDA